MKLRILNVLTKTAPTIPQTPHTDLKYPYVPKMAIRTHCAQLYLSRHEDDTCRIFHEEEKLVSDSAGDAGMQTLKT